MKDNLDTRLYNEFGFEFPKEETIFEQIIKANSLDKQMTISETASYLNLSIPTVQKRIKNGKIKSTIHGKQFRILKAQFHD